MADVTLNVKVDSTQAEKALNGFKGKLDSIASTAKTVAIASGAGFAALTGSIVLAAKSFADFESQLTATKTLLDETSFEDVGKSFTEGFKDLGKGVLDVFRTTGVELESTTSALFDIVSAGVPASEAIKALGTSARLSVAGVTSVKVATDGLTSVLNAYGLSADKSEAIAGKFFLAQKAGKTTIDELASSFGLVGSTAQALGVSFEEVLASVSSLTLSGVKTSQAFTGLKAAFSNIVKPTADAQKEAKRLGVAFNQTALSSLGLKGFLDQITSSAAFNEQSVTKLFGSVEAVNAIFALTGQGAESFGKILKSLGSDTEAVAAIEKAFQAQLDTFSKQTDILSAEFKSLTIELGKALVPTLKSLNDIVKPLIDNFKNLSDETKETIAQILLISTVVAGITFAVSSLIAILPSLIAGFAALKTAIVAVTGFLIANPIVAIIAAVVAALAGLYIAWKNDFLGIQEITFGVFNAIGTFIKESISNLSNILGGFGNILIGIFTVDLDQIKAGISAIGDSFTSTIDATVEAYRVGYDERKKIRDKELKEETDKNEKLVESNKAAVQSMAQAAGVGGAKLIPKAGSDEEQSKSLSQSFQEGVEKAGKNLSATIGEGIGSAFTGVTSAIGGAIVPFTGAISGAIGIAQSIVDAIPNLLASFGKLLNSVAELPLRILEGIQGVFSAAINLVQNLIPNILNAISGIIESAISFIFESLPDAIFKLFEEIPKILIRFFENLPSLFAKIGQGLVRLLIKLPIQIISGLIKALPDLINAIVGSIDTIAVEFVFGIIDALETIDWEGVVVGIADAIPRVAEALVNSLIVDGGIEKIVKALIQAVPRIAVSLVGGILSGLSRGASSLGGKIAEGFTNLARVKTPDWLSRLKIETPSWLSDLKIDIPDWLDRLNIDTPDWLENFLDTLNKFDPFGGGGGGTLGDIGKRLGFASGGIVPEGFPNDSFPASLTSGELVVPESTVPNLFRLIDEAASGGATNKQPLVINLQVGEQQLANVLLNLNRQGFRTA